MNKLGYFFDLDGTLVNTHKSNLEAYRHAIFDVTGIQLDEKHLQTLEHGIKKGCNYRSFVSEIIEGIDAEMLTCISEKKADLYPSYIRLSTLNHDLVNWIERTQKHSGAQFALVTTAKRRNAEAVLAHHRIDHLFSIKIFGDDITASKPDPEIYLKALMLTGLQPEDALAFEDSLSGIEAAKAAGIEVEVISWTHDNE